MRSEAGYSITQPPCCRVQPLIYAANKDFKGGDAATAWNIAFQSQIGRLLHILIPHIIYELLLSHHVLGRRTDRPATYDNDDSLVGTSWALLVCSLNII